ncbi:MAG: hypothetical protein HYT97_08520 [Elusimicrobia bacterium]|nr:hypothetical protein [Elusimicrobiota bacterium]
MTNSVRTAISLRKEDYQHLESVRKKLDKSRSEIFQEAIHDLFHKIEIQNLENRYAEGYRKKPEDFTEMNAYFKAGRLSIPKERW